MSDQKEKDSNWMQNLWRPAMGWMYMLICLLDMAIFPVLWNLLQAFMHQPITQWNPLTLQGAGLFHLAMGAVLGIAAFGRTQEKIAGTAVNATPAPAPSFGAPATQSFGPTGFGGVTQTAPAFGSTPLGGNQLSTAPAFGSAPTFSSSGKPMPVQPEQPIL